MGDISKKSLLSKDLRISIQIDLSGYSFSIYSESDGSRVVRSSGRENYSMLCSSFQEAEQEFFRMLGAGMLGNVGHGAFLSAQICFHTPSFTLVPKRFFAENLSKYLLDKVCSVDTYDEVNSVSVEWAGAEMIYALPSQMTSFFANRFADVKYYPSALIVLDEIEAMKGYNRVVADYRAGLLVLAIADASGLLLCNSFRAQDFKTALYYILFSMKEHNFNPEQSSLVFVSGISDQDRELAMKYLHDVTIKIQ